MASASGIRVRMAASVVIVIGRRRLRLASRKRPAGGIAARQLGVFGYVEDRHFSPDADDHRHAHQRSDVQLHARSSHSAVNTAVVDSSDEPMMITGSQNRS